MIKKMTFFSVILASSLAGSMVASAAPKAKKAADAPSYSSSSSSSSRDGTFRVGLGTTGLDLTTSSAGGITHVDLNPSGGWIFSNGLEVGLQLGLKSLGTSNGQGGSASVVRFLILPEVSYNFGADDLVDSFYARFGIGLAITSVTGQAGTTDFAFRPMFGKRFGFGKNFAWSPELGIGFATATNFTTNIVITPVNIAWLF